MAEDKKTPEERIADLEKQVEKLKKRGGGMLSSNDFRKRVIFKRNDDDESYAKIEAWFRKREWDSAEAEKEIRRYKDTPDVYPRKCFIMEPYDELNLTPFSYDLSIGNDILSVRKKDPIRKRLPYCVEPGETVILLTKEFIALPPCYSATVWPRFKLVREGVFQSMVKIDPTWYGKLGVAMANFSPRTIPLEEGMAFGTLVIYELSSNTDLDLWKPEKLKDIRVEIPNIPLRKTLQKELVERDLTNVCWVEDNSLVVRGLKKSSYDDLRKIDGSKPWLDTVEKAKAKWLESRRGERRSIGMEALGMEDLEKLVEGPAMGKAVDPEQVKAGMVTQDALREMAIEHGKPFDLLAAIPKSILEKVEKEIVPHVEPQVGARLYPQILQLTMRLLALLSLIGVAVALAAKYFDLKETWLGVVAVLTIPAMFVTAILILGKFPAPQEKMERKTRKLQAKMTPKNIEIEKEYRFPRLVSFALGLLSRPKKK